MSKYDDTVLLTFIAGLDRKEILEATYTYGLNPLDMIGEPEPPRIAPERHGAVCTYVGRLKHFEPYIAKLIAFHELRGEKTEHTFKVTGPTGLLSKFWWQMVYECKLIPF